MASERRALAAAHGWTYRANDQRLIQGWPRPVLPPGPLGRVRNAVSGTYRGRAFTAFDYVHVAPDTGAWQSLQVCAVRLPASVPYVEVRDPEGGAHDVYAESPEVPFAFELLSPEVCAQIRRYALTSFHLDDALLICTDDGGGPTRLPAKLDALADLLDRVPDAFWERWRQR
ncbi:hypothetical protein DEF23_03425 [Marinitenerispora sediminis]|uniref:Uncharacterized protein n=1 Tax=Marinitenerispora sediminis TaxID=1931232 RepID=A0A368T8R6_9ACTN|nr:hypothetical protein DEF28_08470 [Marinitenerispora sediminis]RCV60533.1 hypothetical protein DEF24_06995 [Marinitenerispora sediminis]RCV61085.1 hypothetical protein DEF23_03425 [Marinitenerispora sediminis]